MVLTYEIHEMGPRVAADLVLVDCSSLPKLMRGQYHRRLTLIVHPELLRQWTAPKFHMDGKLIRETSTGHSKGAFFLPGGLNRCKMHGSTTHRYAARPLSQRRNKQVMALCLVFFFFLRETATRPKRCNSANVQIMSVYIKKCLYIFFQLS